MVLLFLCARGSQDILVFKGEIFHGVCLQKKLKEEKTIRRSMRGSVTNKQKVESVHRENLKVWVVSLFFFSSLNETYLDGD